MNGDDEDRVKLATFIGVLEIEADKISLRRNEENADAVNIAVGISVAALAMARALHAAMAPPASTEEQQ